MKPKKQAVTQYPVLDLIRDRWSPRAFLPDALTDEQMLTLLEAASWAPSASNLQPRRYIYAHRADAGFDQIWSGLVESNQPWTKQAAVLLVAIGIRISLKEKNRPTTTMIPEWLTASSSCRHSL